MTPPELLRSPSLLRRLAAMFYDAWLVFTLMMAGVGIMIILRISIEHPVLASGEHAISGAWRIPTFLLMVFILCHFYVYFWVKNGQTLGMQSWRIRLDNANHEHISLKQAYIRLAVAALSWATGGLGYVWMYFNRDRLTWHDQLSNTRLVLLPKPEK